MNLTEARDSASPPNLADRLKELLEQSRRHQSETARIRAEIEAIQNQLAALGTPADHHTESEHKERK